MGIMPGFAAVVSCGRDKIIKIAFQLCQGCPKLFPATIAGVYDLFVPAIGVNILICAVPNVPKVDQRCLKLPARLIQLLLCFVSHISPT